MKHLLLTTIAAVVLVGCGPSDIHQAGKDGNMKAVKQHLAAGADVNAKNKYGQTPLDLADALARAALFPHNPFVHRRKRTETADLLRKHGGKTGEELKAEGN
jgi:hypothetical protein